MERFICIHGHFYQPPRENPWLEAIETQNSAYPYHDWNARIAAECYATNAHARLLDAEGRIARITNNYAQISFNFGPTLLTWMEEQDPETYAAILAADQQSRERFGGHGSALAQVYNHLIMPLANQRDRQTQVRWGIEDFASRFGRPPEGMWLAETAVDLLTLEILAEQGIRFTILAPRQAARIRPLGEGEWTDVSGAQIDPTRAYRQQLPSGRTIDLFFYDGPISQALAFEHLLASGESFAQRLAGAFNDERDWPQLVHIATDGETYGHHHRHGEMALAYALNAIEEQGIARLTNYGEYLEIAPPSFEVEIIENSSWSCEHGIERWRADCGCNGGGYPEWNQAWRAPLRQALDWLRDTVAPIFEEQARPLFPDPWAARDAYIACVLDRDPEQVCTHLQTWAGRDLSEDEVVTALQLLEMQRHALLMYTSCGWFFDELSGIETVQVVEYAGRVVQLAWHWAGDAIVQQFADRLEAAKSNLPDPGDGKRIFDHWVRPTAIGLRKVAAHYAMSDLFEHYPDQTPIYCYDADRLAQRTLSAGPARLMIGQARITSRITREVGDYSFAALHFENHNLTAGVRVFHSEAAYGDLAHELADAFERGDLAETVRLLDKHFERRLYTLNQLFRDEQLKILEVIMRDERAEAENANERIYDRNVTLLRYLAGLTLPSPDVLRFAAEVALGSRLRRAIEASRIDAGQVRQLLREAELGGVRLDQDEISYRLKLQLERIMAELRECPEERDRLH